MAKLEISEVQYAVEQVASSRNPDGSYNTGVVAVMAINTGKRAFLIHLTDTDIIQLTHAINEARGAVAITWNIEDVRVAAEMVGIPHPSDERCMEILDSVIEGHDANYGISWESITSEFTEEDGAGVRDDEPELASLSAWTNGYIASMNEQPITDNPHSPLTHLYTEWAGGWLCYKNERCDDD